MKKLLILILLLSIPKGAWSQASTMSGAGGGGNPASSPNTVYVSPGCPAGNANNCYQVFADGQYAVGSTWTTGVSGGSAATLLTTNSNDFGAQYLQITTPQNNIGSQLTSTSAGDSILAAFKVSGTPTFVSCVGANEVSGPSGTVTSPNITVTGGSGHVLFSAARSSTATTVSSIVFSDSSGSNTWNNVLPFVVVGSPTVQMSYVQNPVAGTYSVVGTLNPSGGQFNAIFVCELSGMASSGVLDAATDGLNPAASSTVTSGMLNTSGSDLLIHVVAAGNSTSTFTAGLIGITPNSITTSATLADPPFICPGGIFPCTSGGDAGKKAVLSSNCSTANGYVNCNLVLSSRNVKIYSVNSSHNVTLTAAPIVAATVSAHGFTGWFIWLHDDTAQLQAAFSQAISLPGTSIIFPCGFIGFSAPPFIVPATTFPQTNPNMTGCGHSTNGTVFVATSDFNYATSTATLFYSSPNVNSMRIPCCDGVQGPFPYAKLSDFEIWGGGVGDSPYTTPIFKTTLTEFDDIRIVGWTTSNAPVFSGTTLKLNNVQGWSAGSIGLQYLGDNSPVGDPGSLRNSFFLGSSSGIVMSGGTLITYNNALNSTGPGGIGCSVPANYSVQQSGGTWVSHQDELGGLFTTGGSASIYDNKNPIIGPCSGALNLSSGTPTVFLRGGRLDTFTMAAGTFQDGGGNHTTATPGTSWTAGTLSITGGTILGTGSVTGVAITAPKLVLSAGWGTTAAWTSLSGFTKRVQGTLTASGTGQAANPTITYTFPTPFAQATNVICKASQIGGTQAAVANPFTVGVPSVTSVVFTYTGTPGAGNTLVIVIECDAV